LIAQAILASPDKQLRLNGIYETLAQHYPDLFSLDDNDWQNTIRHNLSLNRCFVKLARATKADEKRRRRKPGMPPIIKGSFWTVNEQHLPPNFVPLGQQVRDMQDAKRKRDWPLMAIASLLN
jgi:hypothetical protein